MLFALVDLVGRAVFGICPAVRRKLHRRSTAALPADEARVVLLIQLDHLGDAIISTAMLPALRATYPGASIEVLAGSWNREVFEASPQVDRVHVARVSRFARSAKRLAWIPSTLWWGVWLRRRKVDVGIDVRGDFPAALLLWLCGARRRVGWECGGGGFLLTDRADFVPNRPEVESRWALLAALGIPTPSTIASRRPRFVPTTPARRAIAQRLADFSAGGHGTRPTRIDGPLAVLHVGAGTPAKRWPVEHWRELLGRILLGHAPQVVLVGSGDGRIIADRLLGGQLWPSVVDWTGRLTFAELAALLQQADVMVGADSGPAHLAAAVGTPVVVLFSGTNDARQWRPYACRVRFVRHDVDCSPCHRERCPWPDHPCMRRLRPRRVAAAVQQVLDRDAGKTVDQGNRRPRPWKR